MEWSRAFSQNQIQLMSLNHRSAGMKVCFCCLTHSKQRAWYFVDVIFTTKINKKTPQNCGNKLQNKILYVYISSDTHYIYKNTSLQISGFCYYSHNLC